MDHLSFEQLEVYSRDKTTPEDLASIEEHLLICEQCRRALDRLEEEARIMREALKNYKKPDDN
jgi:predicted anti-sigma-YlaC factor YlaD